MMENWSGWGLASRSATSTRAGIPSTEEEILKANSRFLNKTNYAYCWECLISTYPLQSVGSKELQ